MSATEFDYIIVGAGSAGCVLANRLSANGKHSVLLLEAGPADTYPWIHVPIGYGKTMFNRSVNWGYYTEPHPDLDGRSIYWPRGRVLGGSSSINGLIYIRGQPEDYDDWERAGNLGWGWRDVLPYFRRSEEQQRGADAYHGVGGELAVSDVGETNELVEAFIRAGNEIGYPRNDDFNGPSQEGVGYFQLNTRDGRRCSTARGFLRPVLKRPNIEVRTDALCAGLVTAGHSVRGLRYYRDGELATVHARREVILAAGAINSPQILEFSGIGDGALLRERGVDVVHHLPGVGDNLQDHLQTRLICHCTKAITTNDDLKSLFRKARIGLRYLLFRKGPLAVGINQAGGFVRSSPELERPDIQYHFGTLSSDQPGSAVHKFSGFTLSSCQLRPRSRGSVHIDSLEARTYPRIDPCYISEVFDQQVMIAGVRASRALVNARAMQPYVVDEYAPGPDIRTDDELLDFVRQDATTIFHPVGTCKMGRDADAVVDERLRVHGVAGLRVVDCSIMPSIVSGNTNAPAIMIAEKAADMILEDAVQLSADAV